MPDKRRKSPSPSAGSEGKSSKRQRIDSPPQECQPSSSHQCSICLNTNPNNGPFERLSCGHEFHRFCLWEWLSWNESCPLCRRLVTETPETEGDEPSGEGSVGDESPRTFGPGQYEGVDTVEGGDQMGREEEMERLGEAEEQKEQEEEQGEEQREEEEEEEEEEEDLYS
ncbi:hypothetical protein TWF970_003680 [Orbilia oligospora]|uniref:RING-type domain-containing protein n=1 Tax=Orbilia oligospora TaxID=2813651 RepID=A0A7C8RHD7_ORBOL|nr:hypothetical protein TWF970_003680 [Orbilia oligospora]